MSIQKEVCVHQPNVTHILPTHELNVRRTRKLAPSVSSKVPRETLDSHPRTGRRTVLNPNLVPQLAGTAGV